MSEKFLNIELATPSKKESVGQAMSCSAPGVVGRFQILPGHTDFISELGIGEVKVEFTDGTRFFATSGGFLEVVNDQVLLLLEAAEAAEKIDIERAAKAKERAERRLKERTPDINVVRAEAALSRAVTRISIAEKSSTR